MKASSLICMLLVVTLGLFIVAQFSNSRTYAPRMSGDSARLPCLANNHCPMGQKCASGFCSEGFVTPPPQIADMSSCTAKECNGLNAPCARKEAPCPEGTFCQGNNCVSIVAPSEGAAYNQIGMLLD